jgi:ABC-type hemin transport system substrate-binding protein
MASDGYARAAQDGADINVPDSFGSLKMVETRRIVSFLPSATEMTCALGLSDQLLGITHECDYPPGDFGQAGRRP